MPRRANPEVTIQDRPLPQLDLQSENLAILRTQWRWAAFSQFYFTFFPLFALNDVSVADIEHDLVTNTRLVLPRIMQKMLYSLSYDRKVSLDNWQTAIRKQYNKRDPMANPIGPEPHSIEPVEASDDDQTSEQNGSQQIGEIVAKDDPLNPSERGVSVANTISSTADLLSSPTPLNEPDSTRQSSIADYRHAPSSAKGIENEVYHQKSIDWFDLPMLAKLESMHTVAEWQFQNPTRLKTIMKSDDEFATWRIEPIGYDSKRNAYWLIGADRLWIQRAPPNPVKSKALKRKRPSYKPSENKRASKKTVAPNVKRPRMTSPEKPSTSQSNLSTPGLDRHSRAAKDQAKRRLDAQAKELAELNRQAAALSTSVSRRQVPLRSKATASPSRIVGTRTSARLRGSTQDDEWQPIPDEWLNDVQTKISKKLGSQKTGLESDQESVSDLTELSEDMSDQASLCVGNEVNGREDFNAEHEEEDVEDIAEQEVPVDDFVEWETICSTLYEWEHISERFERATHYSEKALYKVLVNDVVPVITQELREIERKRQLEVAIVHRKRSSRIALRESEKEEARMAAQRKQDEVEKMSRARRLEARKQREEEDRLRKEHGRELRRKERETRDEVRKVQLEAEETKASRDTRKTKAQKANGDQHNGSRTPAGEDWELDCEICKRYGVNLDDGMPMMSCGICSRWQHIQCHDDADCAAGRPRRNWKSEDFICSRCRATQRIQYNSHDPSNSKSMLLPPNAKQHASLPGQPYSSQLSAPTQSSHYLIGYRDPLQQNYYTRPNGQQYPNMQYPSGSATPSTLSFSHYQPSQHAFFPTAPQKLPYQNVPSSFSYSNSGNTQQTHHQHRRDPPLTYNNSQQAASTWNANTATTQTSGYSMQPNNTSASTASSSYRPSQTDNHYDLHSSHSYSNHEPQTSYTRYSTDHHSSTPYKQPVPF